MHICNVIAFID